MKNSIYPSKIWKKAPEEYLRELYSSRYIEKPQKMETIQTVPKASFTNSQLPIEMPATLTREI